MLALQEPLLEAPASSYRAAKQWLTQELNHQPLHQAQCRDHPMLHLVLWVFKVAWQVQRLVQLLGLVWASNSLASRPR